MQSKQLNSYQYAKQVWWFNSLKNANSQWCESLLERNYLLSLEFDDDVLAYKSQPLSIVYSNALGKDKRYTPDVLVRFKTNDQLIEVKHADHVSEQVLRKLRLVNKHHYRLNRPLVSIVTNADFSHGETITNLVLLYNYKKVSIERCHQSDIITRIDRHITLGELLILSKQNKQSQVITMALIAHNLLKFDMSKKLTLDTMLEVSHA